MSGVNARNLDFNLLPVLVAVAETGSVTAAAAKLYLTQSAVSAALGRLKAAIGEAIVIRHGRGVVLTDRGARLVAAARPHLDALLGAALWPAAFDAATSDRTLRLGLADVADEWLLPALLREMEVAAPHMRLIVSPITFRTVVDAITTRRIDLAVTVTDELPASITHLSLAKSHYVCLFDPRQVRLGTRPTEGAYLAQDHIIVSYNGDLRGVVEEAYGRERRIRCAVANFSSVGAIVDGSRLVATIPIIFTPQILALRPHLRLADLPFAHEPGDIDLVWSTALDADPACQFVRDAMMRIANDHAGRVRSPSALAAAPRAQRRGTSRAPR